MLRNKTDLHIRFVALLVGLTAALAITLSPTAMGKESVEMWLLGAHTNKPEVASWLDDFQQEFNATNPDIELEIRSPATGTNALYESMLTAIAGGIGPDLVYVASNIFSRMVTSEVFGGIARPINEYLERSPMSNELNPAVMRDLTFSGKTMGIPYAMWPIFVLRNLSLFDQNGIAEPTTWAENLEATKSLTQLDSDGNVIQYGYSWPLSSWLVYELATSMYQLGETMIEPDATRASFNNDAGLRAFRYVTDLVWEGMLGSGAGRSTAALVGGQTAATLGAGTQISRFLAMEEAGHRLGFGRMVGPEVGDDVVRYTAAVLMMVSTTRTPDEAWRVMEAFAQPENLKEYYMIDPQFHPVHKSLVGDSDLLGRPFSQEIISLLREPVLPNGPQHQYLTDWLSYASGPLQQAVNQEIPVPTALLESERLLNARLQELNQ